MLVLSLLALGPGVGFLSQNLLRPPPTPGPTARLDTAYMPQAAMDIVISTYAEALPTLSSLIHTLRTHPSTPPSARVYIYTKSPTSNLTALRLSTNATVTRLPNIGREGETYLTHILTHWDDLARHVLFLQASVHNPREAWPRLARYFTSQTGMLSLGPTGTTCPCGHCGDRWGWTDSGVIPATWAAVYGNTTTCGTVGLTYKGQFIASAKRIRGVGRGVYEALRMGLVDMGGEMHGPRYVRGREDRADAPYFGFAVERVWGLVLQCAGGEAGMRCPSLLAGWRRGGESGDCGCFDG
ncbi:hypothetical protein EJ06DRAFT_509957 [Trichodelitschia bisporula]|uniref:Glycosyltransferase family 2 protein n=1 Tax=Trichodelitschia bisporula TaxID=703511 RepID=A0A6G1HYM4_9PEZI|nr:hypothetical protein EJ06DRAFT_509957 [Trichodelitschia bisporula]